MMSTDTPEEEGEEPISKQVGKRTFTDNRENPQPLDGSGYEERLQSEGTPVKLKCPYCGFAVPIGAEKAERRVRKHITQSKKGRHKDRNAFTEMMFIHAVDEDGEIIKDVKNIGMAFDSQDKSADGKETTTNVPEAIDTTTKRGQIIKCAMQNPEYSFPEISKEVYGERGNGYVNIVLEEYLSDEEYNARKVSTEDHGKRVRKGMKRKQSERAIEIPEVDEIDITLDAKKARAAEARLRFPKANNSTYAIMADVANATARTTFKNYIDEVNQLEELVEAGKIEGPPYLTELPFDDTPVVYVLARLFSTTKTQRRILEYALRNDFDHEGKKSNKWVTDNADASNSGYYYAMDTYEELFSDMSGYVASGEIAGPPYIADDDGNLLHPVTDDSFPTEREFREFTTAVKNEERGDSSVETTPSDADSDAADADDGDDADIVCEVCGKTFKNKAGLGSHKNTHSNQPDGDAGDESDGDADEGDDTTTESAAIHPDVATNDTVVTTDTSSGDDDTLAVSKADLDRFVTEISALQQRAEFEATQMDSEAALREQYILSRVSDFLATITDDINDS